MKQKKEKRELGLIIRFSDEPSTPELDRRRRAEFFLALYGLSKDKLSGSQNI